MPFQEVIAQNGNVFLSFAKRRDIDFDHVKPEVKVVAEFTPRHGFIQSAICQRQYPHVNFDGPPPSKLAELAILENVKQFGLETRRHLSDFIQEHAAFVREFKFPRFFTDRAREGSALITEQL